MKKKILLVIFLIVILVLAIIIMNIALNRVTIEKTNNIVKTEKFNQYNADKLYKIGSNYLLISYHYNDNGTKDSIITMYDKDFKEKWSNTYSPEKLYDQFKTEKEDIPNGQGPHSSYIEGVYIKDDNTFYYIVNVYNEVPEDVDNLIYNNKLLIGKDINNNTLFEKKNFDEEDDNTSNYDEIIYVDDKYIYVLTGFDERYEVIDIKTMKTINCPRIEVYDTSENRRLLSSILGADDEYIYAGFQDDEDQTIKFARLNLKNGKPDKEIDLKEYQKKDSAIEYTKMLKTEDKIYLYYSDFEDKSNIQGVLIIDKNFNITKNIKIKRKSKIYNNYFQDKTLLYEHNNKVYVATDYTYDGAILSITEISDTDSINSTKYYSAFKDNDCIYDYEEGYYDFYYEKGKGIEFYCTGMNEQENKSELIREFIPTVKQK